MIQSGVKYITAISSENIKFIDWVIVGIDPWLVSSQNAIRDSRHAWSY